MKNLILSAALLITTIAFGQNAGDNTSHVITTSVTESLDIAPTSYSIILSLAEKVNVDSETQETKPISIEMILKKLTEKMSPYQLDKDDLVLYSFSETTSAAIMNGYNGYNNYSASKKKLLSRMYKLQWTRDVQELETFLRSLRFNGFEHAQIIPIFNEEALIAVKERLFKKAVVAAKRNANILAKQSGVTIGALNAIVENDNLDQQNPYNYYNQGYVYPNANVTGTSIFVSGNNLISRSEKISLTVSYTIVK